MCGCVSHSFFVLAVSWLAAFSFFLLPLMPVYRAVPSFTGQAGSGDMGLLLLSSWEVCSHGGPVVRL